MVYRLHAWTVSLGARFCVLILRRRAITILVACTSWIRNWNARSLKEKHLLSTSCNQKQSVRFLEASKTLFQLEGNFVIWPFPFFPPTCPIIPLLLPIKFMAFFICYCCRYEYKAKYFNAACSVLWCYLYVYDFSADHLVWGPQLGCSSRRKIIPPTVRFQTHPYFFA